MSHRYLHDFTEEPSLEEKARQGTERLDELSAYPVQREELPPLPPWYWRWWIKVWRLFPCTIISLIVMGSIGALFQFGGDVLTGLKQGILIGALFGCFCDSRFAMKGKMIDD